MIVYRFRADTAPLFALKYPGVGVTLCGYPPGYVYAVGTSGQAQGPAPTIFFASITRVVRCIGWMHFRADTGVCPYAINFPVAGVALCGYPPVCDIGVGVTPRGYPPGNVHGGVHFRADTGVCPYTFKPRM